MFIWCYDTRSPKEFNPELYDLQSYPSYLCYVFVHVYISVCANAFEITLYAATCFLCLTVITSHLQQLMRCPEEVMMLDDMLMFSPAFLTCFSDESFSLRHLCLPVACSKILSDSGTWIVRSTAINRMFVHG